MTALAIYNENGKQEQATTTDFATIAETLKGLGVQFERWQADRVLAPDADQESVLSAYKASVDKLNKQFGFQSLDVVSLGPDHPDKDTLRKKFLSEHTHADFEVRYFVDGSGLFYLHVNGKVYLVMCAKGDLISVPANTTHWFDMGEHPNFKCIRFFTAENGWVGDFTGSEIATKFPSFDEFQQKL
ncbi:MAG TPA: cupin [Gammaproteobacteria bacterium]